jgi:hypothetical protein
MRCGHVLEECPSMHNIAGITSGCDYCQEQPITLTILPVPDYLCKGDLSSFNELFVRSLFKWYFRPILEKRS